MAGALKGITLEIGGDTTKLGRALDGVQKQATSLQRELRGVNALLKQDPSNAHLIAQKYTLLGKSIDSSKEKLNQLKQAQRDIDSGKIKATEEQYRDLQREIAATEIKIESLTKEYKQFASVAGVQLQNIGKQWQEKGQSIVAFGQKFMALTVGIAAVGAASTIAAIQFESSFAGVRKTVNATEEEFQKLADASREMAMNKPVDVNDINLIMELGGQLGIAKEQLDGFASVISDLDVATNLSLEEASSSMAQFANITGMAQSDFDRFGSTIVALGNTCATTEADIMSMAMRIAGAGSQVGMTQAEILGFSAALSSVGINAEAGGSAISTIISKIDKEVALNGETLATWAELAGMSVEQFSEAWKTDAAGAMQAVVQGMGDASKGGENLNLILSDLGITELRQTDMMKRLSNASGVMVSSLNTASGAWEENTALTNEAAQRYATTESQLIMLKNRIVDAGISIGQGLQPALVDILNVITPVAEGIANMARAYSEMNTPARNVVTTIALMAAGFAPLMILTGKLTSGLGSLVVGLGKASTAMAIKAAATTADTAAETANTAATNANAISSGIKSIRDNLAAVSAAKKAAATTVDTVATAANTKVTIAGTIAKTASTVATKAATIAQMAWNAVLAANPIGAVIIAVGALAAGIALLCGAMNDAKDDTDELTLASKEQEEAVDDARAVYEEAVETQGENSDAALKAKAALMEEEQAFASSKQTIEEFCTTVDATVDSHNELMDSLSSTYDTANNSAGAILNMNDRLLELASNENKSAAEKAELVALTESLNGACAGLNLVYDEQNDKLNMNADAIRAITEAEADRLRGEAAMEAYTQLLEDEIAVTNDLEEAKAELAARGIEVEDMTRKEALAQKERTVTGGHAAMVVNDMTKAEEELVNSYYDSVEALEENKVSQAQAIEQMTETINKQSAVEKAVADVEAGTRDAAEAAKYYSEMTGLEISADEILEAQAVKAAEAELAKAEATSAMTEELQEYINENPRFVEVLEANGMSVDQLAERLQAAGIEVDELTTAIENHADRTQNAFEKIETDSEVSMDEMLKNLEYNTRVTNEWSDNIASLYAKAGSESEREFISYIASLGPEYAPLVDQLNNDTTGKLSELAEAWRSGGDAAKIAALAEMGLLKEGMITETGQLTEEAEAILAANAPEMGAAGAAGGAAYTEQLAGEIAKCPESVQQYIASLEAQLQAAGIDIKQTGATTGSGYSDNLASAIAQCPAEVQQYIQQLESQLAQLESNMAMTGTSSGTTYGSNMAAGIGGQTGNVGTNAAGLQNSANRGVSSMGQNGTNAGRGFGVNLASGISGQQGYVNGSAAALQAGARNGVSALGKMGASSGKGFGSSLAVGISSAVGDVGGAASSLSFTIQANAKMGIGNGDAKGWMSDMCSGLVSGMSGWIDNIANAASSIASTIRSYIHFSVPDVGPLTDYETYMPDMVQGLADTMTASIPTITQAAHNLAGAASAELQGINANIAPDVSTVNRGIKTTFGVDIERASLDAIQLNSTSTAERLDVVIAKLENMTYKLGQNYQVVLNNGVVAGEMTPEIDKNLGKIQRRRAMGI